MFSRQIALHFVQDKNTRFDLAIECGNLDVALETAQSIDRPECWERLAQQALKQGNHKVGHDLREGGRKAGGGSGRSRGFIYVPIDRGEGVPAHKEFRSALIPVSGHWQHQQADEDAEDRRCARRPHVPIPQRALRWRRSGPHCRPQGRRDVSVFHAYMCYVVLDAD